MENAVTFGVSETAVQRARGRVLAVGLSLPVFILVFFLLSPFSQGASAYAVGAMIFVLVVIEAIVIIESSILIRKLKEMTLTISAEGIERTGGRFTEKISFSDLHKAAITEYPSGQVASIKLDLREQKPVILQGFDKMEWIAEQIEAATADKSKIHRKRLSIDWDNPWLMVAIALLTVLVILLIQGLSKGIYQIFNVLFLVIYGFITLVYRPISQRLGKRFEKFEIILGVFMILCAVFVSIGLIANYVMP